MVLLCHMHSTENFESNYKQSLPSKWPCGKCGCTDTTSPCWAETWRRQRWFTATHFTKWASFFFYSWNAEIVLHASKHRRFHNSSTEQFPKAKLWTIKLSGVWNCCTEDVLNLIFFFFGGGGWETGSLTTVKWLFCVFRRRINYTCEAKKKKKRRWV